MKSCVAPMTSLETRAKHKMKAERREKISVLIREKLRDYRTILLTNYYLESVAVGMMKKSHMIQSNCRELKCGFKTILIGH